MPTFRARGDAMDHIICTFFYPGAGGESQVKMVPGMVWIELVVVVA